MSDAAVIVSPILRCRWCDNAYLAVTWIDYRQSGYCTEKCREKAEPPPEEPGEAQDEPLPEVLPSTASLFPEHGC